MAEGKMQGKLATLETRSIDYGLAQGIDVDAASQLYLRSFPDVARKWFPNEKHAAEFYRDLFDLMRLAHGRTFFVARCNGRLVGYLILTFPNAPLVSALGRERFVFRVVANAILGRYGFSPSVAIRALQMVFARPADDIERKLSASPHIYSVAVDKEFTGRGIGSSLITRARAACGTQTGRMWLYVHRVNSAAIRLYERIGFRILSSSATQHAMVWDFETE
jgi:ribosomal protein S18 acetylase RimI-like enzyme